MIQSDPAHHKHDDQDTEGEREHVVWCCRRRWSCAGRTPDARPSARIASTTSATGMLGSHTRSVPATKKEEVDRQQDAEPQSGQIAYENPQSTASTCSSPGADISVIKDFIVSLGHWHSRSSTPR